MSHIDTEDIFRKALESAIEHDDPRWIAGQSIEKDGPRFPVIEDKIFNIMSKAPTLFVHLLTSGVISPDGVTSVSNDPDDSQVAYVYLALTLPDDRAARALVRAGCGKESTYGFFSFLQLAVCNEHYGLAMEMTKLGFPMFRDIGQKLNATAKVHPAAIALFHGQQELALAIRSADPHSDDEIIEGLKGSNETRIDQFRTFLEDIRILDRLPESANRKRAPL